METNLTLEQLQDSFYADLDLSASKSKYGSSGGLTHYTPWSDENKNALPTLKYVSSLTFTLGRHQKTNEPKTISEVCRSAKNPMYVHPAESDPALTTNVGRKTYKGIVDAEELTGVICDLGFKFVRRIGYKAVCQTKRFSSVLPLGPGATYPTINGDWEQPLSTQDALSRYKPLAKTTVARDDLVDPLTKTVYSAEIDSMISCLDCRYITDGVPETKEDGSVVREPMCKHEGTMLMLVTEVQGVPLQTPFLARIEIKPSSYDSVRSFLRGELRNKSTDKRQDTVEQLRQFVVKVKIGGRLLKRDGSARPNTASLLFEIVEPVTQELTSMLPTYASAFGGVTFPASSIGVGPNAPVPVATTINVVVPETEEEEEAPVAAATTKKGMVPTNRSAPPF
jgi:hypothetical protein